MDIEELIKADNLILQYYRYVANEIEIENIMNDMDQFRHSGFIYNTVVKILISKMDESRRYEYIILNEAPKDWFKKENNIYKKMEKYIKKQKICQSGKLLGKSW